MKLISKTKAKIYFMIESEITMLIVNGNLKEIKSILTIETTMPTTIVMYECVREIKRN